uniref:Si:ch211-114l13.12 n=1 Tax=Sinocyclocheilus anshuiensis TaxID=1608454 RepID=A0A671MCQ6_9TELE
IILSLSLSLKWKEVGVSVTFIRYSGGGINITCKYERKYTENAKYFCRGQNPGCSDLIKTEDKDKWVHSERFSLYDDTRAAGFTVTIRDLSEEDSGTYQCGVDIHLSKDSYTEVKLNVLTGEGNVDIQCPYESGYEEQKKYLCRGECPIVINKDKPVESESAAKDKRFSLTDNKTARIFTVTITDLRTEDQGKYWCGVKTGFGNYDYKREIYLEIKHGKSEYTVCVLIYEQTNITLKYSKVICQRSVCVCESTVSCFLIKPPIWHCTHLILFFLCSDLVSRVSGVTGEHLKITCRYDNELKDNVKIICKASSTSLCEKSIKVSSEKHSNGRFSLSDNASAGVFTVNIAELTEEDSGIYWCGAIQRGQGHKNKWISVTDLKISAGKTPSAILYYV